MQLRDRDTTRPTTAAQPTNDQATEIDPRVTRSLNDGLTILRNAFYRRLHDDVERNVGMDSMIMPVSRLRAEQRTKLEIELYQIAVAAGHAVEHGYVADAQACQTWLTRLRLGEHASHERVARRLREYQEVEPANRRLHFTNVLTGVLREAERAPLVLFRLFPLSVRIATSIAFADHGIAKATRAEQLNMLPAIADCHHCHGRLLDNEESCKQCGSPVWSHRWLTAVDED